MGFEIERFIGSVHKAFICNICNHVLDDAVQVIFFLSQLPT